jgi:hypothetical protein
LRAHESGLSDCDWQALCRGDRLIDNGYIEARISDALANPSQSCSQLFVGCLATDLDQPLVLGWAEENRHSLPPARQHDRVIVGRDLLGELAQLCPCLVNSDGSLHAVLPIGIP